MKKFAGLMTLILCAGISSGVFFPSMARADGPYLDVKLAAVTPATIRGATQVGSYDLNFEDGISAGISVGWAFDHFRSEVELNILGADFDVVDNALDETITDGSMKTAMVNAYYDLTDGFPVTPYVGLGAGMSFSDLGAVSDGGHLAYQAMAGFRYNLSGQFWVGAEYRYMNTKTDGDLEDFKSSLFMATFSVGF